MSERNLEELSALMDGEVTDLEVRRVLKNIEQDQVMCQKWGRYQLTSAVLKGETHGHARQWQALDLSARVSAALEHESSHSGAAKATTGKSRFAEVLVRPFANVAVAASVSAAVILGWQSFNNPASVNVAGPIAAISSGGGMSMVASGSGSSGLMPVAQTSGGFRAVPASVPRQDIIRYNPDNDDQLNDYLISHSSNAAFNTATSMAPYARAVGLKPVSGITPAQTEK